jgi:ATP-dependent protease ClpP protease subunit
MTHRLIVGGELLLYGAVGDPWADGSGFTAREVIEALSELGDGDITARVNSGGGYAWEGTAIYNALRAHEGKITVYVDGVAASAASTIVMAGSDRILRSGAGIMIHDPSSVTFGTAAAHDNAAKTLNALGNVVAGIYARATGKTAEECRELMLAETWMYGQEAVDLGFATAIDETSSEPTSAFDYGVYMHTPASIPQAAVRPLPSATAATPAQSKEPSMADPIKPAGNTAVEPVLQENPIVTQPAPNKPTDVRDVTMDIMSRCRAAKMSSDDTFKVIDGAKGNVETAKDLIITMIADRDPQPEIRNQITITADARDRFKEGAAKSLMAKAGLNGGEVNEFTGYTLKELARQALMIAGMKSDYSDPMEMAGAALGPTMAAGMHSTSDFAGILGGVANKSMLRGYEEVDETFELWTSKGTLTDFKAVKRLDLGLFPSLTEVPEGAEYTYGTMGERAETIQLATYGKMFAITRQAIINDDMGAFTRVPLRMGRAARRTIGNLVYAILNDNPAMSDGKALFHADHGNLANPGTVMTTVSIDAARAAMAKQKDSDGISTALNIRPKFLLVPVELQGAAQVLMESEFDPAKTQRAPNIIRNIATVISDARLNGTSWFLAGDPNSYDTIEVDYLNGNSQPTLEQRPGWNVDGVEYKVRIDAGVKAVGAQALYKNPGAAS